MSSGCVHQVDRVIAPEGDSSGAGSTSGVVVDAIICQPPQRHGVEVDAIQLHVLENVCC